MTMRKHIDHFSIKRVREPFAHHFARHRLGNIYTQLQEQGNAIEFEVSNAKRLPETYIDIDVYAKFKDEKQLVWFELTSKLPDRRRPNFSAYPDAYGLPF